MIWGLDISHHQGAGFPLARARAEGFDFAFFKATEGAGFVDRQFAANLAAGRAAGMLVAAYHYQRGDVSAAAQVAHIQRHVPRDVPIVLDVEANGGDARLTRDLNARLNAAGYRTPLLYLPKWYWQQIGSPDLRGLPPLWFSRYPDNRGGSASQIYGRVPASYWNGYGGLGVEVLQFSSSATVAGRTPIDVNAYRGSREQLAALFGGAPGAAPTAPGGIEDMALDTRFKDWANNDQTVEAWMNHVDRRLAELHHAFLAPGSQASRIPGDKNVTNLRDAVMDSTAWSNITMREVFALRSAVAALGGINPSQVAEALRPVLAEVVGPVVAESVTAALGEDNQEQAEAIVDEINRRLSGQEVAA